MIFSTLCYIEQNEKYLMLHRVVKKNDVNKDKWIGVGGKFEEGESPEDCLKREVKEETGLTLTSFRFRGILSFFSVGYEPEYICLYTADGFTGDLIKCEEGTLEWVEKSRVRDLPTWAGDAIFLRLLEENRPFFREIRQLSVDITNKNIDNVFMEILSMGMTGDYMVAIEEGATMVRVGTGIFGERNYKQE